MSLTVQTPSWPEANFSRVQYGTYVPFSSWLVKISTPERPLALQHRSGRAEAVFGVNAATEGQAGRRLIATGKSMPEDWLAISQLPLRAFLKQVV
jgi:hypothetical protein